MLVDKTISKRHEVTGMLFLDDFLLAYLDLDCLFMHVLNANVSVFFFGGVLEVQKPAVLVKRHVSPQTSQRTWLEEKLPKLAGCLKKATWWDRISAIIVGIFWQGL